MSDVKHVHNNHGGPPLEHSNRENPPYWTRAHKDWRMWVGLILMLAAMTIFIMSDDLALLRR